MPNHEDIRTLEDFLGEQRLTHLFSGRTGVIGIDDVLWRFHPGDNARPSECPKAIKDQACLDPWRYSMHRCHSTMLSTIEPMTQDEYETANLVMEIKRFDRRVVSFHPSPNQLIDGKPSLIYAIDEDRYADTSGKILIIAGTRWLDEWHSTFMFAWNLDGIPEKQTAILDKPEAAE